jgi:hypothetical protein
MRARATVAVLAVIAGVALGGCSSETSDSAGGGDSAPPLADETETTPSVEVPVGAKVLDRTVNRGENPSAGEFGEAAMLEAPLPDLYIRITTEPAAEVFVNGSVLCEDVDSGAAVESTLPLTEGAGELVVRVRPPRGVRAGMSCHLITAGNARTDPGKITRVTSELLAAR